MKKFLLTGLCLLSTAACLAGMTACADKPDNKDDTDNTAHSHSWSGWTVTEENKPTDTEAGKATRTCSNENCDATQADKEYALPNLTSEDYSKTNDTATCSAAGSVTYTYNKDGVNVTFDTATPVNPEAHNYGAYTYTDGTGHYKVCANNSAHKTVTEEHDTQGADGACSECGYKDAVLPPAEHTHDWGDGWTVTDENKPTDTETGKATRTCSNANCDATEADKEYELPALTSEDYSKTDDTATCNAAGSITYTYNQNGVNVSFTVATSATGHDWGDWEVTDENKPTDTATGKAMRTCSHEGCDATTAEKEHELPNLTSEAYTKTDDTATCSAAGTATYTYEIDGEEVSFEAASPVNSEAHSYGDYKQKDGGHYRVCTLNSAHKDSVSAHNTDGENGVCSVCGYETIDGAGTYYIEAEKLDPVGVIARDDFISAGRIISSVDEYCIETADNPHGGYNICGLGNGSHLNARFTLEDKASVRIYICAKSNLGIAVYNTEHGKFYIDGTQVIPKRQSAMNANNNSWIELEIADYTRLEAGNHTFTIEMVGFNYELDYIKVEVIGYGENADGKSIDINLNGTSEQKFEAEWIGDCDVKIQNGQTAAEGKDFPVFTSDNSSNGMFIGGLNTGTVLNINFNCTEQTTVKIVASIRAGIPVQIWNQGHCKIYIDGELITVPANQGDLTSVFAEKILFEGNLSAGDHVLKIEMNPFGFDMDYITFVPISD